jgi:7,8-dihydro-6-hydroxymethylpterin-pyrophosphokinase
VEYKESDKIVYYQTFFGKDLRKVKVNGDTYTYYNSPVYKEAGKRYSNLLDKIGTTRDAERKAEIKKRIDEKYEREKEALEIIRR